MNEEDDNGVSILLGDPKKAIRIFSKPMMVSLLVQSLYPIIDSIWVSGLGVDNLSAVGFVLPIFLIVIGFAEGLEVGATSLISRLIGAKKKDDASNTAWHVILLSIILTLILSISTFILLKPALILSGSGSVTELSMTYGNILFVGIFFFIFNSAAMGIFIGKGDVKKATYIIILSALINIGLDPIFIYQLKLGLYGAAIATVISVAVSSIINVHCLNKDRYLNFSLEGFKFNIRTLKNILNVSIPVGSESIIIGILDIFLNSILSHVSGNEGVATYSVGFNIILFFIIPLYSIRASSVSVMGAIFGSNKLKKLTSTKNYILKIGFLIAILISIVTFCFSSNIANLFAYSQNSEDLKPLISEFLKIMCIYYLTLPLYVFSTAFFQSIGKGINTFIITFIREFLLVIIFSYILAISLEWGMIGVWWGIAIGNTIGDLIGYAWSNKCLKKVIKNTPFHIT